MFRTLDRRNFLSQVIRLFYCLTVTLFITSCSASPGQADTAMGDHVDTPPKSTAELLGRFDSITAMINMDIENSGWLQQDVNTTLEYFNDENMSELTAELLRTHTISELCNAFKAIDAVIDEGHATLLARCNCSVFTSLLEEVFEQSDAFTTLTLSNPKSYNKEGYYSQNKSAEPQNYTIKDAVIAQTFNAMGEVTGYERRNETQKVTRYGDFSWASIQSYYYSEGRYGWVNGVFHNELPHWVETVNHSLWYKGNEISTESDRSILDREMTLFHDASENSLYVFHLVEEVHPEIPTESHLYYDLVDVTVRP